MTGATDTRAAGDGRALPVIDMAPLFSRRDEAARLAIAGAIEAACRESGFFYVIGHGVSADILDRLEDASRRFFALPHDEKMKIAMHLGGPAWRGFFPVGDELTSGKPDNKEGIYFGTDLPPDHPRVAAGWPLHGANLWPDEPADLRPAVTDYMSAATRAAHALMEGISLSLGLEADYFERHYTADPTVLFRIFHYPARAPEDWPAELSRDTWGAGEHTDYGLLTMLAQDRHGGLEVRTPQGWVEAPPIEGALVCNIGDMLERLTGGFFRSTPHRVLNRSGRDRLSFPLFFDPDFAAVMRPLPVGTPGGQASAGTDPNQRWDGADLHAFEGTYGDYLMGKVAKVFPDLGRQYLAARNSPGR